MARPWGDSLGYRLLRGLLGRALRARALDVEGLPANLANAPVYVLEERSHLARLALESVCLRRGLPLAQGELAGPSTAPGLVFCAAGKATGCSGGAAPGAFPKPCPRSRSSLAAMPLHKSSPFPSSGVEPLNARVRSSPWLFSERWSATGRLRRWLAFALNRHHIFLRFAPAIERDAFPRDCPRPSPSGASSDCCGSTFGLTERPSWARTFLTAAP